MGQNTQPPNSVADMRNKLNPDKPSFRDFSWDDMVRRAWGGEFTAPDHNTYLFSGARGFDSTDRSNKGLYGL